MTQARMGKSNAHRAFRSACAASRGASQFAVCFFSCSTSLFWFLLSTWADWTCCCSSNLFKFTSSSWIIRLFAAFPSWWICGFYSQRFFWSAAWRQFSPTTVKYEPDDVLLWKVHFTFLLSHMTLCGYVLVLIYCIHSTCCCWCFKPWINLV